MIEFKSVVGCKYKWDYEAIFQDVAKGKLDKINTYRTLILGDLWFVVYFVLGVGYANHPFVVKYCQMVESGPPDYTLDLVARGHFKTSVITKAEVIQKVLKNPESRIGIFSHTRPAAKSFLRGIKIVFEGNEELKGCFPDVLYRDPAVESPKWSEDDGLIVRRKGKAYNESTIEAWGLIEGMPTGKHFTHRVYDDIETPDIVASADQIEKQKMQFNMSQNLVDGEEHTHRVTGTPYHHAGVLAWIRDQKGVDGGSKYFLRKLAATDDGTANGKPVLISQEQLDKLKTDEYQFNCQQLCDPTPISYAGRLRSEYLKEIHPERVPDGIFKFMAIDPAGGDGSKRSDAWGLAVVGVEPCIDEIGLSKVYILDLMIVEMTNAEAMDNITRMYLKAGLVMQLGVEKVGLSTVELNVAGALRARGIHISVDNGTLVILTPAGRAKKDRIKGALEKPLLHEKIFINQYISTAFKDRLRHELDNFPYWKDDGMDAISYTYDMFKDFRFPKSNIFKKHIDYTVKGIV